MAQHVQRCSKRLSSLVAAGDTPGVPGKVCCKQRHVAHLQGAAGRLTAAEARLDAALERALDLHLGAGSDGDLDGGWVRSTRRVKTAALPILGRE